MVNATKVMPTLADAREVLGKIYDPEIPVLSLLELQVIRSFSVDGGRVTVEMTPTFLGCPALEYMKHEIRERLLAAGFQEVTINLKLSPPWSTDLLSSEVREKLRSFGIAPPNRREQSLQETLSKPVECPFCGSLETQLQSPFGPTLCRQIYYCHRCLQSFERFKPL
jgi:ring-1,2-phenylacetyl-CoA epoxidase subunit PaaD